MAVLPEPQFGGDVTVAHQATGNIGQPEDKVVTRVHGRGSEPFLLEGDFLKVTNHEAKTVDFAWGGRHFPIEPGEEKFVPFEALVEALGDPRSMDDEVQRYDDGNGHKGVVMQRKFEIDRLFSAYAVTLYNIDDVIDPKTKELRVGLTSKAPRVTVTTMTGQPVVFPISHPDMLPLPVHTLEGKGGTTDMVKSLDKLASENEAMRGQLADLEGRLDEMVREREGIE
jgi:hypothetical protein